MATLMSWLEAGRRLAERIPYSIVALVAVCRRERVLALGPD
jgi:hypothetical protein